jgi:hypothetical protein
MWQKSATTTSKLIVTGLESHAMQFHFINGWVFDNPLASEERESLMMVT